MKKVVFAVIALLANYGIATAQSVKPAQGLNKNCPAYVDKNNDGVCDNINANRGNRRGNGICMYGTRRQKNKSLQRNTGMGQRQNFVDKNKNGVCDYAE